MEPGFAASEIDTSTPHPARMYDALLGGKDNYAADREAFRHVLKAAPEARDSARASGAGEPGIPAAGGALPGRRGGDTADHRHRHRHPHRRERAPGRRTDHAGHPRGIRGQRPLQVGLCTRGEGGNA